MHVRVRRHGRWCISMSLHADCVHFSRHLKFGTHKLIFQARSFKCHTLRSCSVILRCCKLNSNEFLIFSKYASRRSSSNSLFFQLITIRNVDRLSRDVLIQNHAAYRSNVIPSRLLWWYNSDILLHLVFRFHFIRRRWHHRSTSGINSDYSSLKLILDLGLKR